MLTRKHRDDVTLAIRAYAERTDREPSRGSPYHSRAEFLRQGCWHLAFRARALVVGFNLPFDLTRFIAQWGEARGRYYGGFSCVLWQHPEPDTGRPRESAWAPRLWLKVLDSKRAF